MRFKGSLAAAMVVAGTLVAGPAWAQLPDPGMVIDAQSTALVVTDPQNDFLSPDGVTWGLGGRQRHRKTAP